CQALKLHPLTRKREQCGEAARNLAALWLAGRQVWLAYPACARALTSAGPDSANEGCFGCQPSSSRIRVASTRKDVIREATRGRPMNRLTSQGAPEPTCDSRIASVTASVRSRSLIGCSSATA